MRVLITGAAGFIGYHLALKLKKEGHTVYGLDNYNSYYDPVLKADRGRILAQYKIMVHHIDIRNLEKVRDMMHMVIPDVVIHLAAMAGVRYSMDHPQEYIDVNCIGTANVIQAMEELGTPYAIYASTSCVMHGQPIPWKEEETLNKQLNPYGYTKAINESQFHISKIPNAVGLRFFTVYGPWGRPDMALFDFAKNILAGKPITLFNNGDMRRDFTYVDDIVQGINLVLNNMTERDIYCLGNGELVELARFVKAIERALGREAIVEYGPKHPADALETLSDTTKISQLGYKSTTPIELGVENFVRWYRGRYADFPYLPSKEGIRNE